MDNFITMKNGEKKLIGESQVGDIVKSIDSMGKLVNTEIISIMHKDSNSTSNKFNLKKSLFNLIYFRYRVFIYSAF